MTKILVVEDNDTMRLGITETLERVGCQVIPFSNGPEAMVFLNSHKVDVAVVDLKMEPMDGFEVLSIIKNKFNNIDVLIISAYGNVKTAVDAIKNGATDFLTKPFSPDELRIRTNNIVESRKKQNKINELLEQNEFLNKELLNSNNELIGTSESFSSVIKLVKQVAANESSVLIQGESGTGKELIAQLIHQNSNRASKPYIKVNCAALNENLLESELFGHEKGAFTGAIKTKKGRFELADSGTIFLDEIGEISSAMQSKLLRVLQEGEFERVGGETTIKVNVRIISATNKDLGQEISKRLFRDDLYYRLNVIPIMIPSLRERSEDIPLLVEYFLQKSSQKNNKTKKAICKDGLDVLKNYSWPGNIRELENLIERLSVISDSDEIDSDFISFHLNPKLHIANSFNHLPLDDALYAFEKKLIIDALEKSNGVKNQAAKFLKINTSSLYYKLEKFDLLK
jgi:two-component system, NtrC family, response regulator HydG